MYIYVCISMCGNFLCASEQPGLLKKVQGLGWYLEEENLAQVSTNILDFELTPLHAVYQEICGVAEVRAAEVTTGLSAHRFLWVWLPVCGVQELKLPVVGSQVVGLIPLKALLDAADFYMKTEQLFIIEEEHKVRLVSGQSFGLRQAILR